MEPNRIKAVLSEKGIPKTWLAKKPNKSFSMVNGGGKYAEYYTPHAIATIMARLLVGDNADLHSMECYDPSAGTGTLLMALSHQIGEDKTFPLPSHTIR